jgi:UDP-N-acetylmuramate dehydrogenase
MSAEKEGWSGLEFAAGIPGTVGGAVVGNSGIRDFAMGDIVESALVLNPQGKLERKMKEELVFSYRNSIFQSKNDILLSVRLLMRKDNQRDVAKRYRGFMACRAGQPHGRKTAGCVFKNPKNDFAGRLLELAGCKGFSVGDAFVAEEHANFIVNRGSATATDLHRLMEICRKQVYVTFGVTLDYEVKLFGFA